MVSEFPNGKEGVNKLMIRELVTSPRREGDAREVKDVSGGGLEGATIGTSDCDPLSCRAFTAPVVTHGKEVVRGPGVENGVAVVAVPAVEPV